MLRWFRRRLRSYRHRMGSAARPRHKHRHWSRLVYMYHTLPSQYGPNDWILIGIAVAVLLTLVLSGTWVYQTFYRPQTEIDSAGGAGIPVRLVDVQPRDGQVLIRVENGGVRREVAVSAESPLAREAINLQPGTTISVPRDALR